MAAKNHRSRAKQESGAVVVETVVLLALGILVAVMGVVNMGTGVRTGYCRVMVGVRTEGTTIFLPEQVKWSDTKKCCGKKQGMYGFKCM